MAVSQKASDSDYVIVAIIQQRILFSGFMSHATFHSSMARTNSWTLSLWCRKKTNLRGALT